MALRSPIMLSSPPRFDPITVHSSSSPDLPPLQSLLRQRRPQSLRPGSRAKPIPAHTSTGFQSARTLQRSPVEDIQDANEVQKPRKRRRKSDERVKRYSTPQGANDIKDNPSEPNVSPNTTGRLGRYTFIRSETIEEDAMHDISTQNKKQSECNSRQDTMAALSAISSGKTDQPPESETKPSTPGLHCNVLPRDEACGNDLKSEAEYRSLVEASIDIQQCSHSSMTAAAAKKDLSKDSPRAEEVNSFQDSLHTTAKDSQATGICTKLPEQLLAGKTMGQSTETTTASSPAKATSRPSKNKGKPPTKSSRTVTGVALAQYHPGFESDSQRGKSTKEVPDGQESSADRAIVMLDPENASRRKKIRKVKPKEKRTKLLDPESAQIRLERQDIFFGTSSQLTKNEPVEDIRQLQQALDNSAAAGESSVLPINQISNANRLWFSGARGHVVALLEAEARPQPSEKNYDSTKKMVDADQRIASPSSVRTKLVNVTKAKPSLLCLSPGKAKPLQSPLGADILGTIPVNVALASKGLGKEKPATRPYSTSCAEGSRKQSRSRPRKSSDGELQPSTIIQVADVSSPNKRSRGRPRNDSSKKGRKTKRTQANKDEDEEKWATISELEKDTDVTLNSRKLGKAGRSKPKLARRDEREEFLRNQASQVFPHITNAVMNQTSELGLSKLTWHEKILLYDPIVLEDLTTWLNTGPLKGEIDRGVNQDKSKDPMAIDQVEPWMVQLWCEEHSVCCLWREGSRGGVKSKY